MRFFLFLLFSVSYVFAIGQEKDKNLQYSDSHTIAEDTVKKEAVIRIYQDPLITELIKRNAQIHADNDSKIQGWRVQIYNSTGRETRAEVVQVRNQFLSKHPDLNAYIVYQPPIFRIRVGNFRTREEAYFHYRKLVRDYPSAYLVRDQIILPRLETQ